MSAGQGKQFSDPIRTLEQGDIVVAYLKRHGFVGIGVIREKAIRVDDLRFNRKSCVLPFSFSLAIIEFLIVSGVDVHINVVFVTSFHVAFYLNYLPLSR